MTDKLRVLMSGFTTQQIGRPNRLKYRTVSSYFVTALEEAGCEVDIRQVVPGEDLRKGEYDVAFVGLNSPRGLPARFMYGGLWTIAQAREACGGRLAFYVDDWQLARYPQQARSQATSRHTMFDDHKRKCRVYVDEALRVEDTLVSTLEAIGNRPWPMTIYPSWNFGDPEKLIGINTRELVKFNPNPWGWEHALSEVNHSAFADDSERERRWVNASLVAHDVWFKRQKMTWPLENYGAALKAVPSEVLNMGQAPELQVRDRYSQCWGVTSPKYRIGGSGWWRVRALHAMAHGAVWLGDPGEMGALGDAWRVTAGDVEGLGWRALRELSQAQSDQALVDIGSKEEAAWALRKNLERAYI